MHISDKDYFEILVEVGYPVVKEDELEYTREEIQDLFIFPAMREYFSWFPKIEVQTAFIGSDFEFDFPDEKTYGVVDARINSSTSGTGRTESPFMNSLLYTQGSISHRKYGTPYDYGTTEAQYLERAYRKAGMNKVRVERLDVDNANRKLTGFSTINGELSIQWAKYSDNFDDIPFKKKSEVIKLSKAYLLRGLAMLRGQFNSDTGMGFNSQEFISRAENLERSVLSKWRAVSKVAIIRS